jgi:hypothetical protein
MMKESTNIDEDPSGLTRLAKALDQALDQSSRRSSSERGSSRGGSRRDNDKASGDWPRGRSVSAPR